MEISSTEDEISDEENFIINSENESNSSNEDYVDDEEDDDKEDDDEDDDDDDEDDDDENDNDEDDDDNDDQNDNDMNDLKVTRRVKLTRNRNEKSKPSKLSQKTEEKKKMKKPINTKKNEKTTIGENVQALNQIKITDAEQEIIFGNWISETKIETKDIDFDEWQKNHSLREAYFFGPDNVS